MRITAPMTYIRLNVRSIKDVALLETVSGSKYRRSKCNLLPLWVHLLPYWVWLRPFQARLLPFRVRLTPLWVRLTPFRVRLIRFRVFFYHSAYVFYRSAQSSTILDKSSTTSYKGSQVLSLSPHPGRWINNCIFLFLIRVPEKYSLIWYVVSRCSACSINYFDGRTLHFMGG